MTENQKLYSAITKIAWGYIFILVHIKINTMDLLPSFVGYGMILYSLTLLKDNCKTIMLLRPLAVVLIIWTALSWVQETIGAQLIPFINYISFIIEIIELYFNFQLLTDLSLLALQHQKEENIAKKLITRRNIYTVCTTFLFILSFVMQKFFPTGADIVATIFFATGIITLIIMFMIVSALFGLRDLFKEDPPSPEITA
ncbi:MAG: hypothetical protein IKL10_04600 [Clostridia bacterium]|nr:hypothetical protein [Clostridia bacterium]